MGSRLLLPWWEVRRRRLLFSKIRIIEILRYHSLALLGDKASRSFGLIGTHADDDLTHTGQDVLRHFRIGDHGVDAGRFEQALNDHRLRFILGIEDDYQVTTSGGIGLCCHVSSLCAWFAQTVVRCSLVMECKPFSDKKWLPFGV